jgi:hypothetical protein
LSPAIARDGFRVIDVGGGDGSVWRQLPLDGRVGEIIVVDPLPEAHQRVREATPPSIVVTGLTARVEEAQLPDADAIVCSLTLHHVAGRDADERRAHGLQGPGKREVLHAFGEALRARDGYGVLVEADVDCELDLAPRDPQLKANLFDSYVRRCASSILDDLPRLDGELRERTEGLLQHWFLGQIRAADVPSGERDVYELSVARWLMLLDTAGLDVVDHAFCDALPLFHRYTFRPARAAS